MVKTLQEQIEDILSKELKNAVFLDECETTDDILDALEENLTEYLYDNTGSLFWDDIINTIYHYVVNRQFAKKIEELR